MLFLLYTHLVIRIVKFVLWPNLKDCLFLLIIKSVLVLLIWFIWMFGVLIQFLLWMVLNTSLLLLMMQPEPLGYF